MLHLKWAEYLWFFNPKFKKVTIGLGKKFSLSLINFAIMKILSEINHEKA